MGLPVVASLAKEPCYCSNLNDMIPLVLPYLSLLLTRQLQRRQSWRRYRRWLDSTRTARHFQLPQLKVA